MQVLSERHFFNRRGADLLPAAAWTVRLRDDSFDGNAGLGGKAPERGYSEFRRATKDDAHKDLCALFSYLAGCKRSPHPISGRLQVQPAPLPIAGLPQFADSAFNQISLEHAEVLQKKNAVQVVDFMTERASEQALASHFIRFAFDVLRANC